MDFEKERLMMSVEETKKRIRELLNENQLDVIIKYMFLEQKVKKQQEVIDKIISAIQGDKDGFLTMNNYGECNDILELLEIYLNILKGSDNNER